MTWNHRIVIDKYGTYSIREVYYEPNDRIIAWTERPVSPCGESMDEISADIALMMKAFDKSVLLEEELIKEMESRTHAE